jgi:hypothetical protein
MKKILAALGAAAVICTMTCAPAWSYWTPDGVLIAAGTGMGQDSPHAVSDGAGGAIFVWLDLGGVGGGDLYAQRLSATGTPLWGVSGVPICTAATMQLYPQIISDGEGGAFIAWADSRSGNYDIFAQKINALGLVQWAGNGRTVCSESHDQGGARVTSDGAGGAIISWHDARSDAGDIYAQRVSATGVLQWTTNGIAICAATGAQTNTTIVTDGAGGAILSWIDYRATPSKVYAQRLSNIGAALWTANGIAICPTGGTQTASTALTDGAGGAIVVWNDNRSPTIGLYTQRLNSAGALQWAAGGVALVTGTALQLNKMMCSDGAGGAVVSWMDTRSGPGYDIYAQRVTSSGTVPWTANGVAVCTADNEQWSPALALDGLGGVMIFWGDGRGSTYDVYAQRLDASGGALWASNGVVVCAAEDDQSASTAVTSLDGAVIVGCIDWRNVIYPVDYAQLVNSSGGTADLRPHIASVVDVPGDQGGWARMRIERSILDDTSEPTYPVFLYNVWRRINLPGLLEETGAAPMAGAASLPLSSALQSLSGWPIKDIGARHFVSSKDLPAETSLPPGTWELIGSFAACQFGEYRYYASSTEDSSASYPTYMVYCVTAHTTKPSLWFASPPDSGASVDNLAPAPPVGLAGEQQYTPAGLELTWRPNGERDLGEYAIYRGTSAGFVPGPGNLVASTPDTLYLDGSWSWSDGYYYKVAAVDIHGNVSGYALLSPETITDAETPKSPAASFLAQNFPNPFNPTTRIAFGLAAPGNVSLKIYDAAGRLVRVLAEGARPAGNYSELWDGRDARGAAVASGIYFYRLTVGSFTETRKMALLR